MADIEINLPAQIRELQGQIAEMRESLKGRGTEAADAVRDKAQSAVDYTRGEAGRALDLARENPATTAVSLLTIGLLCGLIGYAIGVATAQSSPTFGHRRHWH